MYRFKDKGKCHLISGAGWILYTLPTARSLLYLCSNLSSYAVRGLALVYRYITSFITSIQIHTSF